MKKYHNTSKRSTVQAPTWAELLREAITVSGRILEAYTYFHNYSVGNQLLVLSQCYQRGLMPGPISTFPGWQQLCRHVRKGERALVLCMPITIKGKQSGEAAKNESSEKKSSFTGFVYKPNWFVLCQTEGEGLPAAVSLPEWDKSHALSNLSIEEIPFDLTDGNTQGFARKRQISVSPIAALPHKTIFHELAHVVLGHTLESEFADAEHTPRNLKEVEAEAVALILCESLNLPGADYARGYIQHWLNGADEIPDKSAQKIFKTADVILRAGRDKSSEN